MRATALSARRAWLDLRLCAVFSSLGILTPVDMRYYLAAIPVCRDGGRRRRITVVDDGRRCSAPLALGWSLGQRATGAANMWLRSGRTDDTVEVADNTVDIAR